MSITSFSLHTPPPEAEQTIQSILAPGTSMKLMPTHCLSSHGQLEGFMLEVPRDDKGSVLPVNRTMFHGTSLFEVASSGSGVINTDFMRLQMSDMKESMRALQDSICAKAKGKEAAFSCMPDVIDTLGSVRTEGGLVEARIARTTGRRCVDFRSWEPELPCSISILQSFIRSSHQRDVRAHKLFIAVSGGLNKASDEFYNLLTDVGAEWTCQEVCDSAEVWWLRKASQRARARVALLTAEHFGLKIPSVVDLFSYDNYRVGTPVADTIEYNIAPHEERGTVEFYSACCDTTGITNGIVARMHPAEGCWLFRGALKSSSKLMNFGSMFGCKSACGVFPTRSAFYKKHQGSPSCVNGFDTEIVVRRESALRVKADGFVFQCFDEQFMGNLAANMQWDRNSGVIELVPIIVGLP